MAPRSKKEGYIDWHNSKAKGIVMGDLEPGGMLKGLDYVKAKVVFEFYKQQMLCLVSSRRGLQIIGNKQGKALHKQKGTKSP
ncbi:hypothetical protein ACA910_010176 [Epithemia clementina (nom. ined.)]